MYSDKAGGISWIDLTVKDAENIKNFYQSVAGFEVEPFDMETHEDYVLKSPVDESLQVGVCHAQGPNQDLPPQWLIYFNVAELDNALKQCIQLGEQIIRAKQDMGDHYMAVIQDPAGAVAALAQRKDG